MSLAVADQIESDVDSAMFTSLSIDEENGYTKEIKQLLSVWQRQFKLNQYYWIRNAKIYLVWEYILNVLYIIISGAAVVELVGALVEYTDVDNEVTFALIITAIFTNALGGAVGGINEWMKPRVKYEHARKRVTTYSILARQIDVQFHLEPLQRMNGREFVQELMQRYNDVVREGPTLDIENDLPSISTVHAFVQADSQRPAKPDRQSTVMNLEEIGTVVQDDVPKLQYDDTPLLRALRYQMNRLADV